MFDVVQAKDPLDLQPLEYHAIKMDGKWTARMMCANQHEDNIGILSLHEIADNGTVSPSVECAIDECDFHEEHVRLVGWQEAIRKADPGQSQD